MSSPNALRLSAEAEILATERATFPTVDLAEPEVFPVMALPWLDPFDDEDEEQSGCPCGGPFCAACGCCEHHACPGGCIWASPSLCSKCAVQTAAAGGGAR